MHGVNALARECGLTAQTVSRRMRKGDSADDIRRYAAAKKWLGVPLKVGAIRNTSTSKNDSDNVRVVSPSSPPAAPLEVAKQNGDGAIPIGAGLARLVEIEEMKLRRLTAQVEAIEFANNQRRRELIPAAYLQKWFAEYRRINQEELAVPDELLDAVAAEKDAKKVGAILRDFVIRVLGKTHERLGAIADGKKPDDAA
jgi:DNA-binding Lrp family transcriptional regulator